METCTTIEQMVEKLALITDELYAREFSSNCPHSELRCYSWDDLCLQAMTLILNIKTCQSINMDIELVIDEEHYGYYGTANDAILDLIDIERTTAAAR